MAPLPESPLRRPMDLEAYWEGALRVVALAVAVVVVGALAATGQVRPRVAAAAEPAPVSQEISLAGLGMAAQTVHGPRGIVEAFFPPPVATLSPFGNLVRVFFSHSPQSRPGSSMVIAVNGQPLTTVPLRQGTAAGGVLQARIPAELVDREHPNRLQVTFELARTAAATTSSGDQLYGRVESGTLIHYSLAVSGAGAPGLETYPFSLLATDSASLASPVLKVVLPSPPKMTEVAAALRVLVDLGRRAATQRVRVRIIPAAQLTAPDTQGGGLLLVGRLGHLPGAIGALTAAGWQQAPEGWTAPDGSIAGPDDGLLAATVSPSDKRTPLLLVTGRTDRAIAQAAAGLVAQGPNPLAGSSAVVSAVGARQPSGTASDRVIELGGPSAIELDALASGAYHSDLSFLAPAVARDQAVRLELRIPATAAAVGLIGVAINGTPVASSRSGPSTRRASFRGRLLRPGRNTLSLDLRVTPRVTTGGAVTADADAVVARLQLPAASSMSPDLASLPFPFLDPSQPPARFVLPDVAPGTLGAAIETAIALGHRAVEPPAELQAALASDPAAVAGSAGLLVLGSLTADAPLEPIARALPVAGGGASAPAALQEVRVGSHTVLWLNPAAVPALYETRISGQVAVVDRTGRVSTVTAGVSVPDITGVQHSPVKVALMLLTAAAAAALLAIAVGELVQAQRLRP